MPLRTGRLPMGGAALSSPFPLFTLDCKLQYANICLHNDAKPNDEHRPAGALVPDRCGATNEGEDAA